MAHIEATGAEEDTPSTPPNTTAPNESTNPSQSIRPQRKQKRQGVGVTSSQVEEHVSSGDADDLVVTTDPFAGLKQVTRRTGRHVAVDMAQDSEDENYKARKAPEDAAWACRWCSKEYIASGGSYYNLKAHRDGALVKKQLRGACLGREKQSQLEVTFPHRSPVEFQTQLKETKMSLPWLRIEDFLLRVAFDYTIHTAQLHSRMWAAAQAHQLYLEQRAQVVREIKASDSKILLVSDHSSYLAAWFAPEKDDKSFPLLYTIPEEAEPTEGDEAVEADIVEVFTELNVTDEQEVDPDDAEPALPQPGWEWNTGEDEDVHFDESGIGFTLKRGWPQTSSSSIRLQTTPCDPSQEEELLAINLAGADV
ncbi:hypothetical protein KEM48_004594 [Puccinia striiformis f. sp. tritici PST-130]|nr:hypothetical protein KEM48_004594 [Puccinia striiformis f. sp. tritici PST-130]